MAWIVHVVIADDWEAGRRIGPYEAATRAVVLEPAGTSARSALMGYTRCSTIVTPT